jgi:hypothetical protein
MPNSCFGDPSVIGRVPISKRESNYSIFDSALYRRLNVEWLFSNRGPRGQVFVRGVEAKATLQDLPMTTRESKML